MEAAILDFQLPQWSLNHSIFLGKLSRNEGISKYQNESIIPEINSNRVQDDGDRHVWIKTKLFLCDKVLNEFAIKMYFNVEQHKGLSSNNIGNMLHFYTTVILPVLEYAWPVCHTSITNEQCIRLESSKKRVINIMNGITEDYTTFCINNNLPSVYERRCELSKRFSTTMYYLRSVVCTTCCLIVEILLLLPSCVIPVSTVYLLYGLNALNIHLLITLLNIISNLTICMFFSNL